MTPSAALGTSRSRSHDGLDGSHVRFSGVSVDLDRPASSVLTVYVNGRIWEFTASYREFGQHVAEDSGIVLDEHFSFQKGALRVGSVDQETFFPNGSSGVTERVKFRIGTWEGRSHSVHTHLYGGTTADVLAAFDAFDIIETPLGIWMRRRRQKETPYKPPTLLKEVPEIGLLHVQQLTKEVARTLPLWSGTSVRGGELFALGSPKGATCGTATFSLVGKDSMANVLPDAGTDLAGVLEGLSDLEVEWTADRV